MSIFKKKALSADEVALLMARLEKFIEKLAHLCEGARIKLDTIRGEGNLKPVSVSDNVIEALDDNIKFMESAKSSLELQLELEKSFRSRVNDTPFYGIITNKSLDRLEDLIDKMDSDGFRKYYSKLIRKFERENKHIKRIDPRA